MVQSSRLGSDGFIPWLPRHLFPGHPQNCWFSSKGQLYPPQATQVFPGYAKDTFLSSQKRLLLGDRETEAKFGLWWNDNKKPFLGTSLFRSHHFCLDVQIKPSVAFTSKVLRPKMGWGFYCTLQPPSILSWHGFKSQLSIVCRIVFPLTNGGNEEKVLNSIVNFLPLFDPGSPLLLCRNCTAWMWDCSCTDWLHCVCTVVRCKMLCTLALDWVALVCIEAGCSTIGGLGLSQRK